MSGDVDVTRVKPEVGNESLLQVSRRGVRRNTHGPSDQGAPLPVPQLSVKLERGGDVEAVLIWPESRVADFVVSHLDRKVGSGRRWSRGVALGGNRGVPCLDRGGEAAGGV